jgi:beta-lactamase class A
MSVRRAAFNRYVEDPFDGASASAIVNALARLKRGELLSPASTARLLRIMGNTRTGPNRLKGGLNPGWSLSHKTGTGQVLGPVQAGYNDIGILTAPNGRSYSVAVMIKRTSTSLPTRMALMNNVVRAVIQQHEMTQGGQYSL